VILSWGESLQRLLAALTDDGTLLLSLDNPIGVHRLVQPDAWFADRSDEAWTLADGVDATKPNSLPELRERLAAHGLMPVDAYAAFAEPSSPVALVGASLLGPELPAARRSALADIIGDVSRKGWRDQPVIAEPQWLTEHAVRNGLCAGLAAAWVVAASRGNHTTPSDQAHVILTDQPGTDAWALTYSLTPHGENGWARRVMYPASAREAGDLRRDPAALDGVVPVGEKLEDQLIAICLRHDHPELRRTLMAYAAWLQRLVDAADPRALFATPSNLVRVGDEFLIRDPSWQCSAGAPYEVVLTKAFREFAVELLTGGYNHPWPSSVDANRLTIILGAIAGFEIETRMIDEAVARDVHVVGIVRDLDEDGRREYGHRLGEAGATSGSVDTLSFQRLRQAHARQSEEIARLEDKLEWLDSLLRSRELALTRSLGHVRSLKNSISFRVGRVVISPALTTRSLSRRAMQRLRNPAKGEESGLDL
jgi:hypothetical protein